MHHLLFECGQVTVGSIGCHIVDEWQMLLDVCGRPVGKVLIQQTLITTIEAAVLDGELCDLVEGLHTGFVYKDTRVEAVGPAYVWSSRQFLALEQFIAVFQHLKKAFEKHIRDECPHLELSAALTRVSASRKTHFSNCTRRQQ